MKPARNLLPAATGILGLLLGVLLGVALAPAFSKPGNEISTTTTGRLQAVKSSEPTTDDGKTNPRTRTRARERVEDKKPKEPRVSIPLKTLVKGLRENFSRYYSSFNDLESAMAGALALVGATDVEQAELRVLARKSESEMLAAEKAYIKLGKVTPDSIRMDMSAMSGPADEIAGRTKEGIRAALPSDLAEAFISAIDWDRFYPNDEKSYTRLEIIRKPSGKLIAWELNGDSGHGGSVSGDFKDDGTPLPADQIFPDRWKPFLKGVTILPKDEE